MSWNFNHTGTRAAVAAKVKSENYVPQSVKDAIADVINTASKSTSNGVHVESYGHVDAHSAGLKIEIKEVFLALDDPAAPKPTAPEQEPTAASV